MRDSKLRGYQEAHVSSACRIPSSRPPETSYLLIDRLARTGGRLRGRAHCA